MPNGLGAPPGAVGVPLPLPVILTMPNGQVYNLSGPMNDVTVLALMAATVYAADEGHVRDAGEAVAGAVDLLAEAVGVHQSGVLQQAIAKAIARHAPPSNVDEAKPARRTSDLLVENGEDR